MIPLNVVDRTDNKLVSLEVKIEEHVNKDLYIGPRSVTTFKDGHMSGMSLSSPIQNLLQCREIQKLSIHLTFRGPCFLIYSYNESQ